MRMISGSWGKDEKTEVCDCNCSCCFKKSPYEEKVIEHFGDK